MRVGLEVWSSDFPEVRRTAQLAESLGIDAVYYGESPHDLNLECWSTLAALAAETTTLGLGPVIANVLGGYRSPLLLARQAAAVAHISEGRLDFRTGVGAAATYGRAWWEPSGIDYPGYDQRLAELERFLADFERLLDEGTARIPLTIAARGQRAIELAARVADVWETSFCTPVEFARLDQRFSEAGGSSQTVRALEIDGFVATSAPGVDRVLAQVRRDRATHEDLGPIFERALVGTPTEVAEHLGLLREAGVDQVLVALHDPHDHDAVEALAGAAQAARDQRS